MEDGNSRVTGFEDGKRVMSLVSQGMQAARKAGKAGKDKEMDSSQKGMQFCQYLDFS